MLKKLRIKFVCINMTIVTLMLIIIFYMVIHFTSQNLEQNSIEQLEKIAANPVHTFHPGEASGTILPYFTLQINHQGDLKEIHNGYYDLSDINLLKELVNDSHKITEKTGVLANYQLRFLRISIPNGYFLIFADISGQISTLRSLTKNCILIGIASFLAFLGVSILLANWAIKPVDLAWKQQKQFIADASHELKTPLTVILTNAELIHSKEYKEEDAQRLSSNILTMAKQMRGLVEGLLELSRIDNHSMNTIMESINFSELTDTALCHFEPLFYESGLILRTAITPGLYVTGSSVHLKQVLDILFDNALKYADKNSCIEIELKNNNKNLIFSVTTCGTQLSKNDLKNIFRRFYKADPFRNNSESYGLGLAIADSIIKEHKGRIWAKSQEGKNIFFISLRCNPGSTSF